jgi:hypothetical protein
MRFKAILLIILSVLLMNPIIQSGNMDISEMINSNTSLTIEIQKIRSLEHDDPQLHFEEVIDEQSDPDFYVTVFVNGQVFTSGVFWNMRYLYDIPFSVTVDVPDTLETIPIVIQLWDAADDGSTNDRLCDISPDIGSGDDAYDVEVFYDINTGHWTGDDELQDPSGYGRLNGCDDGTIYQRDRDCELWFSINQNDVDNDGIPEYMETEVYGFDPLVNDRDSDYDEDGIPNWWEWKYGFDPTSWDDHMTLDMDNDGLPTINEYRTSQWFSDPYTRDLFIELDQMCEGPTCDASIFPDGAKEMLYTAYDRQNVVYHLDDGSWEETGSEYIPYDDLTTRSELQSIYYDYFLHGDENNWRKEIFHYGVVIWQSDWVPGYIFGPNRFQIAAGQLEEKIMEHGFNRNVTYASAYMHETGHTLDFHPIPGHNEYGWLLRLFLPLYKSCMSYGWIYRMVDYSDGSRPFLGPMIGDYDDWERMDLTYFLRA